MPTETPPDRDEERPPAERPPADGEPSPDPGAEERPSQRDAAASRDGEPDPDWGFLAKVLAAIVVAGLCIGQLAVWTVVGTADGASQADRRSPCVGHAAGCAKSLQERLDAAEPGDTVRIGPGTYKGGVEIKKSVTLVGAGPKSTVIRGGGPVLTIGKFGAQTEPKVTIRGVKITGGVTRSSPMSEEFTGEEGVFAAGGGILIPPNAAFDGGAKVTIQDSVIAGNRVAPRATVTSPSGARCPGDHQCQFGFAGGAGIDSWGELTLSGTVVRNNVAGGRSNLASDAVGGGIASHLKALTLRRTRIVSNEAIAASPAGRFAEGGGVFAPSGPVTLRHSSVSHNRAILHSRWTAVVETLAVGGGMQLAYDGPPTRIVNSRIADNVAKATNSRGPAAADSGGVNMVTIKPTLELTDSAVVGNEVIALARDEQHGDAAAQSGAGALAGDVFRTRMDDNAAIARSRGGDATASSGASLMLGRMVDGSLVGNSVTVSSRHGRARAGGGALHVDVKPLLLDRMTLEDNTVSARGDHGYARGGAIFNDRLYSSGAPLTLIDTTVAGNAALGEGVRREGGGVFADDRPVTQIGSAVFGNAPDQCFGC
jgi:hypothetical protein